MLNIKNMFKRKKPPPNGVPKVICVGDCERLEEKLKELYDKGYKLVSLCNKPVSVSNGSGQGWRVKSHLVAVVEKRD